MKAVLFFAICPLLSVFLTPPSFRRFSPSSGFEGSPHYADSRPLNIYHATPLTPLMRVPLTPRWRAVSLISSY